MRKIKWGVVGLAKIAVNQVIPALTSEEGSVLHGVASRSMDKARSYASENGVPKYYGSYADMFADPEIEAVYIPLPNQLHVPISLQAAEAGKHVLCEKPAAMNIADAERLEDIPSHIHYLEAFMVRFHLQWHEVRNIVRSGRLGEVRSIQAVFSYCNNDPENIRNSPVSGGGGLLDIGCYPMVVGKMIFGGPPKRVLGLLDIDPVFRVDRLASCIFDYGQGRQLSFTVSTQLSLYQRVGLHGTKGRLEVAIPFNPVADKEALLKFDDGSNLDGSRVETIKVPPCNQYREQFAVMNRAIRGEAELPFGIPDAIENMRILSAVFQSAKSESWEELS